jgi:hypothetical protein
MPNWGKDRVVVAQVMSEAYEPDVLPTYRRAKTRATVAIKVLVNIELKADRNSGDRV